MTAVTDWLRERLRRWLAPELAELETLAGELVLSVEALSDDHEQLERRVQPFLDAVDGHEAWIEDGEVDIEADVVILHGSIADSDVRIYHQIEAEARLDALYDAGIAVSGSDTVITGVTLSGSPEGLSVE